MHQKNIVTAGVDITKARKVLILLHGRGGSAEDILSLANHLQVDDFALMAPQATNHTWYPYSFLAPPEQNEPWLSSALDLLTELVDEVAAQGISNEHIFFCGFSQGACLALEFTARHAKKYGGIIAFTGGLIGNKIQREHHQGNFGDTPVFIGSSDPDLHVPVERVYATVNILKELGADVTEKIYPNIGHTIIQDEITEANRILSKTSAA